MPDGARVHDGRDRLRDRGGIRRVPALAVDGERHGDHAGDPFDGAQEQRHRQPVAVGVPVRPGDARAGGRDRARPQAGDEARAHRVPDVREDQDPVLVQAAELRCGSGSAHVRLLRKCAPRDAGRRTRARAATAPRGASRSAGVGRAPRAVGGAAQQADVARRERVRLAQRADRDVLRGPLADAADGAQARDRLFDRPERAEELRIRHGGLGERDERRAARAGHAERPQVRGRHPLRRTGTSATARPARRSSVSPQSATSWPASFRAATTVTCWPRIARTASSKPSQAPGARRPGRCATSGRRNGSRERCAPIVSMSAPTSNTRRTRASTAGMAATEGKRTVAARLRARRLVRDLDRAQQSLVRDRAPVDAVRDHLDAGDRALRQVGEHRVPVVRRLVAQAQRDRGLFDRAGRAAAQRARAAGGTCAGTSR